MFDDDSGVAWADTALADRILSRSVKSQFDKDSKEFIPEGALADIITKETIEEELRINTPELDENRLPYLVEFIHTRAIKLFAIAVCLTFDESLWKAMDLFCDNGFTDRDLPVSAWKKTEQHRLAMLGAFWKPQKIRNFYSRQWEFLAPILAPATESRSNYDFKRPHIMPFIEKHNDGFDRGSFGQVYKYKIHPRHLVDPKDKDKRWEQPVAVKEILPRNEDRQKMVAGWEREASVLQKMNALQQPNIVKFIMAFRRGDKGKEDHYLMFEWADGMNLRNLWRTLSWNGLTADLAKGAVNQILGLAKALCMAHYPELRPEDQRGGPNFRHGDLKPENILWFRDDEFIGTLKIADWGLAKQNNVETELRSNNTSTGPGTRRYKPPEEETGLNTSSSELSPAQANRNMKKRSRLYDVWAMGCISLEFLVWLLYGPEGLGLFNADISARFAESPPFYQTEVLNGKTVARVHDSAVKWMDHMAKDPACSPGQTALGGLLELIRTKLLVVSLPTNLGTSFDKTLPGSAKISKARRISSLPVTAPATHSSIDESTSILLNDDQEVPGGAVPDILVTSHGPSQEVAALRRVTPGSTPAPRPLTSSAPTRARADEFVKRMEEIFGDEDDESYWFTEFPDRSTPPELAVSSTSSLQYEYSTNNTDTSLPLQTQTPSMLHGQAPRLSPEGTATVAGRGGLVVPTQQKVVYGETKLADDWDVGVDNDFAKKLFEAVKSWPTFPQCGVAESTSTNLCEQCRDLRDHIWDSMFDKTYQMSDLKSRASAGSCELCAFLWRTCERRGITSFPTVLLERIGSTIRMNGTSSVTLSLFRSPDLSTRIDDNIQISFGRIAPATSDVHFEVIKHWLKLCDEHPSHASCRQPAAKKELPTRLLDVGKSGDANILLRVTRPLDTGSLGSSAAQSSPGSSDDIKTWLALSHRWGPKPHFCTTADNLSRHRSEGIAVTSLSATFRDAVTVTRALGCRYLWIDSLCIVQGDGGDFNEESKRMPQVYSGAYCVLAASRATSHFSGFLQPRYNKGVVALRQGDQPPFYISENVDDFNDHVLESELNSRGWVLQEHALARRSVFFTDHQTYFECGEGVRCETMTTMKNDLAAFLADPNFPQIIQKAEQGEKILRYQDLYKRYSRLGLSDDFDRPIAIDGIQRRILDTLRTRGGFGVFDEGDRKKGLLRRSLLWHRANDCEALKKISFPSKRAIAAVPSWSWMAYMGAIEYISPPFNGVAWERLTSPWSGGIAGTKSLGMEGGIAISATARPYDPFKGLDPRKKDQEQGFVVFDAPGQSEQRETLCVVLGAEKGVARDEARCYLILVRATVEGKGRKGERIYERVGAGWLPGRCIDWSSSTEVTVH